MPAIACRKSVTQDNGTMPTIVAASALEMVATVKRSTTNVGVNGRANVSAPMRKKFVPLERSGVKIRVCASRMMLYLLEEDFKFGGICVGRKDLIAV